MPRYRKQAIDYDIVPAIYGNEKIRSDNGNAKQIEIVSDSGRLSYDELSRQVIDCMHEFYRSLYGNDVTDRTIIEKTKNNTWRGCMTYIHDHVISKIKIRATKGDPEISSDSNNCLSLDTMEQLARIYNHLCNIYNKPQSIMAFSHLCGVSNMTIELWGLAEPVDEVTRRRKYIYKIVIGERLESITTRLFDGGAAPIGTIAVFNQEVLPGQNTQGIAVSAPEALPRLGDN